MLDSCKCFNRATSMRTYQYCYWDLSIHTFLTNWFFLWSIILNKWPVWKQVKYCRLHTDLSAVVRGCQMAVTSQNTHCWLFKACYEYWEDELSSAPKRMCHKHYEPFPDPSNSLFISGPQRPHSLSAVFIRIPQDALRQEYFEKFGLHNYPAILWIFKSSRVPVCLRLIRIWRTGKNKISLWTSACLGKGETQQARKAQETRPSFCTCWSLQLSDIGWIKIRVWNLASIKHILLYSAFCIHN